MEAASTETRTQMQQRHKKEEKELRAQTDAMLAKVPKYDKDIKKKTLTEIQKMNVELKKRHEKEMSDLKAKEEAATAKPDNADEDDEADFVASLLSKVAVDAPPAKPAASQPAPVPTGGAKKVSRAHKKKLAQQEKEKEKVEKLHQLEETQNSARLREYEIFKQKLEPMRLKIREVVPDGNCLYTSLAEQLKLKGKSEYNRSLLRIMAGNYMEEHPDDFMPFMDLSPEQYKQYCQKVKVDPSTWGSQLEIQALVAELKVPVHIYSADAPIVKMGEEYDEEDALLVAYHKHAYALGEHYNSIVPESASNYTEDQEPEHIAQRRHKKNKKESAEGDEDQGSEDDEASGSDMD